MVCRGELAVGEDASIFELQDLWEHLVGLGELTPEDVRRVLRRRVEGMREDVTRF